MTVHESLRMGTSRANSALEHLIPIQLLFEEKVVIATKVCIELSSRDELQQIGVEAHLVASDRVEEWHDALVEEVEQGWEVDDECAAEGLDVVLLEDVEDLEGVRCKR